MMTYPFALLLSLTFLINLQADDGTWMKTKAPEKPAPAPETQPHTPQAPPAPVEPSPTSSSPWLTHHAQAVKKASDEKKILLADFTGSDWCGWCIKLKQEIFDTPAFLEYAQKNLVLLELDFPRNKEQPEEIKKQNESLREKYDPEGIFPKVILFDPDGNPIGELGYTPDGPEGFIRQIEEIKKSAPKKP